VTYDGSPIRAQAGVAVVDRLSDSIVVKADPDSIMDVIADFDTYLEWQDEIKDVEVLETDDDGWATRVRFKVDAMITEVNYVLAYTYTDTAMRWTLVEADKLKSQQGSYELADQGDGTTLVTYNLELEPSIKVPSMIRKQGTKRIATAALKSLKRRVESGA
jgi:ribosome-associated toxin RatA of RatAB toxin-antitoxin module